ncbi:MAG: hypothetical protein ACOVLC_01445 [Flavobacterium sp.]
MNKLKVLTDLLPIPSFAVVVFCFLLPFIVIKCGDTEIASVSGFDLVQGKDMKENFKDGEMSNMLGNNFKENYLDKSSEDENVDENGEEKETHPNYLLLISLFMAINGFIVSFLKFKAKPTLLLVFSLVGLLGMAIFALVFFNAEEMKQISSSSGQFGSGILKINLSYGYWVAIFFFLVYPVLFGLNKYFEKLKLEDDKSAVSQVNQVNQEISEE